MAADGSIIIDTRIDTSDFVNLKQQFSGLASTAKKLGVAIGAAFSVRAITQFAKECLDLGSDLQEVQNVVDVTFTTMNEQVNAFAQNAVNTAGLSETMAKRYAGTFGAMAKAFGFAESEAFAMSTALTQLAGDVASFYNITQDEAYTKLKSVFTGETESLKDLGVVMTQAALDSYALANGYGKTTAAMSEQEKVALRYAFVMDQLTAASGDFLRTSDGWANQTRVLALQFEQLKATIGQGLINALTPVIKVINTILAGLMGLAKAFAQFTSLLFGNAVSVSGGGAQEELAGIADGYEAAAGGANDLAKGTEKAGKAAKKYLAGFDEIQKLGSPDASGGGGSGGAGGGIGGIGGFDFGAIGAEMNLEDNISPQIEAMVAKIRELIAPLREIDFTPLKDSLGRLGEAFGALGGIILDGLEWAWFNILVPLAKWTIEEAAPAAMDTLSAAIEFLTTVLDGLEPLGKWLWDEFLKPLGEWTGEIVIEALNGISDALTGISDWISENQELVNAFITLIGSIAAAYGAISVLSTIAEYIGSVVALAPEVGLLAAMFPKMSGAIASAGTWITGTLVPAITAALGGIASALGISVGWVLAIVVAIGAAVAAIVIYWDEIVAGWEAVIDFFAPAYEWFGQLFESILQTISEKWEGISSAASDTWDKIVEFFTPAAEWFSELFGSVQQTVSDVFKNIGVIASGCWQIIRVAWSNVSGWFSKNVISPVSNFFVGMWAGLKSGAARAWNAIKSVFGSVANFFKDIFSKAWAGVVGVFSKAGVIFTDIKDAILTSFKAIVNSLITGLNSVIQIPFNGINEALKKIKSINIMGMTPFSGLTTISVPKIPYLAKGAVIPPNAPFMAVLGDQRHGTNIEAPLATIEEAVANVMSRMNGIGNAQVIALLQDILEAILGIEIDGETISRAVDNYKRRIATARGGST